MADRNTTEQSRVDQWLVTVDGDQTEWLADLELPRFAPNFAPIMSKSHGETPIDDIVTGYDGMAGALLMEQASYVQFRYYLDRAASGVVTNPAVGSRPTFHVLTFRDPVDTPQNGLMRLTRVRWDGVTVVNSGGKRQVRVAFVCRAPLDRTDPIWEIGAAA